jgi:valyl-tRNA synthetase
MPTVYVKGWNSLSGTYIYLVSEKLTVRRLTTPLGKKTFRDYKLYRIYNFIWNDFCQNYLKLFPGK